MAKTLKVAGWSIGTLFALLALMQPSVTESETLREMLGAYHAGDL